MPWIDDNQLAQGERLLSDYARRNEERLNELEQRPQLEAMTAQWTAGRQALRHAGWGHDDIGRLENFMQERGIASHEDARRVMPYQPSSRGGAHQWTRELDPRIL